MHRTTFGEPRPKGMAEMVEAMDERGVDPSQLYAECHYDPGENKPFRNWTAEVRENESGDEVFLTLGYDHHDELVADLEAAGISIN